MASRKSLQSRQGAYTANAHMSAEAKRAYGSKGLRTVILGEMEGAGIDTGDLEQRDPAEFARRYEQQLKAHMTSLSVRGIDRRAELKSAKATITQRLVLVRACPKCNEEAGLEIPDGYLVDLCIKHWIAANMAGFNAVLDEAQARIAG